MSRKIESNYEQAAGWWPEMPNKWSIIGVRDHYFKGAVHWNGGVLADPCAYGRHWDEAVGGRGVMLTPCAGFQAYDDGTFRQGWTDSETPVLWTEWQDQGMLLRQEAFACVTPDWTGKPEPRRAGLEPFFIWLRYSIVYCCPGLPLESAHQWRLYLSAPHIRASMLVRNNIHLARDRARYRRALTPETTTQAAGTEWLLVEKQDGDAIRLGIRSPKRLNIDFVAPGEGAWDHLIRFNTPSREGHAFDLLLPIIPEERKVFGRMFAAGYDRALKTTNRSWSVQPGTAATFSVPEQPVTEALRYNIKAAEMLGERYPGRNLTGFVIGYPQYARLWATPGAMQVCWLLDVFGQHPAAERYLDLFRASQGEVTPPGSAYAKHPGYLATPPWLQSIDWIADHGAILYALCMHALYTRDAGYLERFLPAILLACDFIKDARAIRGHAGMPGLLPPAVATDKKTEIQSVWGEGWNYKGLVTAVRLLKQIGHGRTQEFEQEAEDYRTAFRTAFAKRLKAMPVWKDDRGVKHHLPPTSLAADAKEETRHVFYLDTGPLFLVFSGLMDAGEEPMQATLEWFRNGPAKRMHIPQAGWNNKVAMLEHEISSMEPCYSWNLFHSHQLGDKPRFLEGLYSLFAGALSKETYTGCESRAGITGIPVTAGLAGFLARLSVIDDEWKPDELHLLRLVPSVWLAPGRESRFENMPTLFGPVSLVTKRSRDGQTLAITVKTDCRRAPARTVLHVPGLEGLKRVVVNGEEVPAGKKTVRI